MFDIDLWVGILILTILLYGLKWLITKQRRVKVYRISPQSLKRSKTVIMAVLPLVEDESNLPLDETRLPYSKDDIKSAAKIMAYYFWRKKRYAELTRIKNCFVAISRFQNNNLDLESQERRASRERKQLGRELDHYMTHSPFNVSRPR